MMQLLVAAILVQTVPSDAPQVVWLTKYQEALQLAQKTGKPIVIDAWRATCPNSIAMHERTLPSPQVAAILASKFVCLKVDADNPGPVEKFMDQIKGDDLPNYVYLTPDGKFITGTSGYRNEATFLADLDGVMKSDALKAAPDVEKKLAKIAEQAAKDLEAKHYLAVLKAGRDADATRGFSVSKDKIDQLRNQVLDAGREKLKAAAQLCGEGKFDESSAALSALGRDFKGSDLERASSVAAKSLDRFKSAAKETDPKAARRFYEMILTEAKDATPFWELARSRMNE